MAIACVDTFLQSLHEEHSAPFDEAFSGLDLWLCFCTVARPSNRKCTVVSWQCAQLFFISTRCLAAVEIPAACLREERTGPLHDPILPYDEDRSCNLALYLRL
jgi:hypothetical protein